MPKLPIHTVLTRGWHKTAKDGLSFGEAVAFVSGEPHTVTPISACPVLLEICNSLNDANFWSSNTERSKHLLPLVSLIANSKSSDDVAFARVYYMAKKCKDRAREIAALDACEMVDNVLKCVDWMFHKRLTDSGNFFYSAAMLGDAIIDTLQEANYAELEKGVKVKIIEETLEDIKYCVTLTSKG